jgi:PAS domain S-box-containing protein
MSSVASAASRHRATTARPMSEYALPELSQAVVEQAPDAIIFADRGGAIRIWNRGAERIFGYARSEALGMSLDLIIPERFRRAHWDGFHRAIETGRTQYGDRVLTTRSARRDGSKLYVDLSFGLVFGDHGAVLGALAVGRDCTARYAADAALRSRLAALEAAASGNPQA